VFFLPIIASAYAFRAYTLAHAKQMEQLESLVKERTQALENVNVALQDLHKEKDAFLAVLTHDMRTPLQSIMGYATFLLEKPDLPLERRSHMARIILRNQENLTQMVSNILDIEKLQSGNQIDLKRDNFDMSALLLEIKEVLATSAEDKAILLHFNTPPHPLIIHADQDKMKRVFTNLVSNAIKYTPEGGEVWVRAEMDGTDCLVSVRDTGYGIPAEALPTIFERFKRVREHQQVAVGTGLGLAIVKSLTEAHGGTVTVESVVKKGSVFRVKVPA
jgi:signal transduction histidine kinase